MDLGEALAIAAAGLDAPAMPRRATAEHFDGTFDVPLLRVSAIGTDRSACHLEDSHSVNLTVLQTTRAILSRVLAMLT